MKNKHPLPIDWTSVCRVDSQLLETHLTMNFSSYQFIANYSNHSLFRIETLKRHVILPRCMDTDQCRQILHYHRIGVFQFIPSTICNRVKLPIKIIDQFTYYCKRINGNVGNRGGNNQYDSIKALGKIIQFAVINVLWLQSMHLQNHNDYTEQWRSIIDDTFPTQSFCMTKMDHFISGLGKCLENI